MAKIKKVVALTGIRSEYDILYPALKAIHEHPDLELNVVVTGAHCSDMHGKTEDLVALDGFTVIERIESLINSNTLGARIKAAGIQIAGLVQTLERVKPDCILVAGDREESMVGALCGTYMNIAVAHMCGGDYVLGNADDSVRHAVTKLAHLHFPMSEGSAERIRKMGEFPWRVHCVGDAALDRLRETPELSRDELAKKLDFDLGDKSLLLMVQHVLSSECEDAYRQMSITFEALKELDYKTVVIFPNSDAGSHDLIKAIEDYLPDMPNAKAFKNLPREEFVNLLRTVDVLVGNSSMGILEAPFMKLPVVNVGNRQKGREHAENVIFVPHDVEAVKEGVEKALSADFKTIVESCGNPFGDGFTGPRIAKILAETEVDQKLMVKEYTY